MRPKFRVALSGDFNKADGSPVFPDFDLKPLREADGLEFVFLDSASPLRAAQLEDIDALILLGHRFESASVPIGRRLTVVARFGVGYDTVDVPGCTAGGIALVITPDGVRRPVAVSIITFMLALTGRIMVKDRLARQGPAGFAARGDHMGVGLVGKTLGSIGVGNIGSEMFRLARAFDMKFLAHDPFAEPAIVAELGIELTTLDDVFARSDVLTINCPLTPETHHLVNAQRLSLMKQSAFFINTARGPIVDQHALTHALRDRRIAGAGIDVFEQEPTDADDPLLKLDNVILAPHALCWTDQCFAGNGLADIKAVLDVQHGRVPRGVVNRDVLATPQFKAKLDGYRKRFGP